MAEYKVRNPKIDIDLLPDKSLKLKTPINGFLIERDKPTQQATTDSQRFIRRDSHCSFLKIIT